VSAFASTRFEIAVIELEGILGLALIAGVYPRFVRSAATAFFALLAIASLYLGLMGQASCGCFGNISINPWLVLGFASVSADSITQAALATTLMGFARFNRISWW
jgi:hypothetical protein